MIQGVQVFFNQFLLDSGRIPEAIDFVFRERLLLRKQVQQTLCFVGAVWQAVQSATNFLCTITDACRMIEVNGCQLDCLNLTVGTVVQAAGDVCRPHKRLLRQRATNLSVL